VAADAEQVERTRRKTWSRARSEFLYPTGAVERARRKTGHGPDPSFCALQAGFAIQDLHLVAEDEDLRLAVSLVTPRSQSEDTAEHHVEEGEQHQRILRNRSLETNRCIGTPQSWSGDTWNTPHHDISRYHAVWVTTNAKMQIWTI
jgi:hypothetical protein